MRLRQGQLGDLGNCYARIVVLERLAVDYKLIDNLETDEGSHHHVKNVKLVTDRNNRAQD